MATTSDDLSLVVEPAVLRFSAADDGLPGEDDLVAMLKAQQDTRPVPITELASVLLDDRGYVQDEFRLTTAAIYQLCAELAPGLSNVVLSLAGLRTRAKQYAGEARSVKKAILLLNAVIRFRFELLAGKQWIIDRKNQQLVGLVGANYRFFANLELYQRATHYVQQAGLGASFHAAALAGRRLTLRYKNAERAFAIKTPTTKMEPFYPGWHFSNSELGDCCVKGSAILIRQWRDTTALVPYQAEARLVHRQTRDFENKLRAVLAHVKELVLAVPLLKDKVTRLTRRSLGLGGAPADHESRRAAWVSRLLKIGVSRHIAEDVMSHALVHGSYRAELLEVGRTKTITVLSPIQARALQSRTLYDVYNAIGAMARDLRPKTREKIEQAAYQILTYDDTGLD